MGMTPEEFDGSTTAGFLSHTSRPTVFHRTVHQPNLCRCVPDVLVLITDQPGAVGRQREAAEDPERSPDGLQLLSRDKAVDVLSVIAKSAKALQPPRLSSSSAERPLHGRSAGSASELRAGALPL
ncbi:hypothetical protein EYF80_018728 [Liparis tanakae]|uniref:Uncharacterized protein n=1 Tax=Liparis tanakae TaxID=230148 RepID=A0A4Z2HZA4_9TELE|nr:hypothetical protein EYF80_018728 [Liparis tanakae]